MLCLEPWNPFDTSDKVCFPDISEALSPECTAELSANDVVDIDVLSLYHPAEINDLNPPELAFLSWETAHLLEAKCQAWFNEQQRLKALRGDSPTPSCSFKLPGIPFSDAPAGAAAGSNSQPAVAGASEHSQQQYASITATCVLDADSHSQPSQQHRDTFAFQSPSKQPATPTHPGVVSLADKGASQERGTTVGVRTANSASPATSAATAQIPFERDPSAVVGTSNPAAASRLSVLMKQNLQQLQVILQDQPQQHSMLEQQQLPAVLGQQPPQHQTQQQQMHSLQLKLSQLLQQNQQQLQELLDKHQQQVQQQHQHQWKQLRQELGQQEQQQQAVDDQLLQQARQLQEQQSLLQQQLAGAAHQQQPQQLQQLGEDMHMFHSASVSVAATSSRYVPGSPERAAAAAAAAVAAANRAKQRVADLAAAASPRSPGRSVVAALRNAAELPAGLAIPARPVATGAARKQLSFLDPVVYAGAGSVDAQKAGSAVSPATQAQWTGNAAAVSGMLGSRGSSEYQEQSSRAAIAAAPAGMPCRAATSRQSPVRHGTTARRVAPWRGLQALQQHRWQQRLHAHGPSTRSTPARSPLKNVQTQTISPPKDEAVQTDPPPQPVPAATSPAAPTAASGLEAVMQALLTTHLAHSSSPLAATGPGAASGLPAVSPVALAAAVAAAAAVTAATAVAAAASPQVAAPTQQLGTLSSPAAVAGTAVAAASAAAAAAVGHVGSPAPLQQQQQPASDGHAVLKHHPHASPSSHVVRSLFASSQPTTPVVAGAAARHAVSSTRLGSMTQSAHVTPSRTPVGTGAGGAHRHLQQEQLQTGPGPWHLQQQQCQQQRPLPWPEPLGVHKSFLSPMKAYGGSSKAMLNSSIVADDVRRCAQLEGGGSPYSLRPSAVTEAAAATASLRASQRLPLGEATNSPGTNSGSPRFSTAAAADSARPATAGGRPAAGFAANPTGVSSSVACVVTGLSDSAIMQAYMPQAGHAAATRVAAPVVSYGSPALQRLWSGYKAGHSSLPSSPASAWYLQQQQSTAATVSALHAMPAAARSLFTTRSKQAAVGSPTAPGAGATSAEPGTGQAAASPPRDAAADIAPKRAADGMRVRQQQQGQQHANAATVEAIEKQASPTRSPVASPANTAAASAAVLAAAGPVPINPKFYPPSARKLLGLQDSREPATLTTAAATGTAGSGGATGAAEQAQLQLRVLLEQQLASMMLARRPLVSAAAAPALAAGLSRQQGLAGQQKAPAVTQPPAATTAAQAGSRQSGADADLDTHSRASDTEPAEGSPGRNSSTSSSASSTDEHGSRQQAAQAAAVHASQQPAVQQPQVALTQTAGRSSVRVSSNSRIARLVTAYQQQQAVRAQQPQAQQRPGAEQMVASILGGVPGVGAGEVTTSRIAGESSASGRVGGAPVAPRGGTGHTAQAQDISGLSEMMQRFLQD